jgi:hypothetical protein
MCYGSTTLIPTKYFDGIGHNYIDSNKEHVCRDFKALRNWTDQRRQGGRLYVERKQDIIHPERYEKTLVYAEERRKILGLTKGYD